MDDMCCERVGLNCIKGVPNNGKRPFVVQIDDVKCLKTVLVQAVKGATKPPQAWVVKMKVVVQKGKVVNWKRERKHNQTKRRGNENERRRLKVWWKNKKVCGVEV